MASLRANIGATDPIIVVDAPGAAAKGLRFRIDDELLDLTGFDKYEFRGGRRHLGLDNRRWIVNRGVGGTVAASHSAGATITAAISASVSSESLTPPDPFPATDAGASAHGDLTGVTSDQHHAQLHAAAHAEGEADEITPAAIGAAPAADPATLPRASYSGGAVSVANNGGGPGHEELTWDTLGSGDALLDLTDPERPTVLAGGIYSVTAVAAAGELLTAGGMFMAVLHLDLLDQDAICEMTSGVGNADQFALVSVTNTFYIPADGVITVALFNFDGSATRSFSLREAMIQAIALDPA